MGRSHVVSGSLAALALCVACQQDVGTPPSPTLRADAATTVSQSRLGTFEGVFASIVSRDPRVRKAAFEKFRENWAAYRRPLERVPASATLPKRVARAYLLGRLGTQEDLPTLRACFEDEALVVRKTALSGLRRLGDYDHLEGLLHKAAGDDFDSLIAYMPTSFEMNPTKAEELTLALARHERWQSRRVAALFLRMCRSDQAHRVLLSMLGDKVWCVAVDACRSVESLGLAPAAKPLRGLLSHKDAPVRAAAIKAFGAVGSPDVLEHAGQLVDSDEDKSVRVAAVQAVSGQPPGKVIPWLARVIERESEQLKVKKEAVRMLVRMPDTRAPALLDKVYAAAGPRLQHLISGEKQSAAAETAAAAKGGGR